MQFKPFFQSKTIVSAFVAFLGFIAARFNVDLSDVLPSIGPALLNWLSAIMQVAGLLGVVIGRFKARGPLTGTPATADRKNSLTLARVASSAAFLVFAVLTLGLTGCGASGSSAAPAAGKTGTVGPDLVKIGYEAENFLQLFNTGLAAAAPSAETFLQQTHNSRDAQTVALYTSLASLASSTAAAALKAGLPPPQVQANVSAALVPANAEAVAENVTAGS